MNFQRPEIPVLASIADLSATRKAWLCDIWGVLHNGVRIFEPAVAACLAFRRRGGAIVLISNTPKPSPEIIEHLRELGMPDDAYNALVTSGDVTRDLVIKYAAEPMFRLGPERDRGFFDNLPVRFVPAGEAALILCTGLFEDEHETPEDYDEMLWGFAARNVPMICGNPDVIVERGNRLIYCAGALAARYSALGQPVIQAGKPYSPIYEAAFQKLPASIKPEDVLAIGDGIDTDIKGASANGLDAVYIASRVHLKEVDAEAFTPQAVRSLFKDRPFQALAALPQLAW
jgi:HAD superfamily hydrolase (TIGR01459 family)